jgi:hypothetical protein
MGLYYAWHKDRRLRRRSMADEIRTEASGVIAKLERWRELAHHFFDTIQPGLVETSEILMEGFDIPKARDHLWKHLTAARIRLHERVLDEVIVTAYTGLYAHRPSIRGAFQHTMAELDEIEESHFQQLLSVTEQDVLGFHGLQEEYETWKLGSDLRQSVYDNSVTYLTKVDSCLQSLIDSLGCLVVSTDEELLSNAKSWHFEG